MSAADNEPPGCPERDSVNIETISPRTVFATDFNSSTFFIIFYPPKILFACKYIVLYLLKLFYHNIFILYILLKIFCYSNMCIVPILYILMVCSV
ncbi:hypothetical protein GCM10008907_11750 [Clostridium sartagoforme]